MRMFVAAAIGLGLFANQALADASGSIGDYNVTVSAYPSGTGSSIPVPSGIAYTGNGCPSGCGTSPFLGGSGAFFGIENGTATLTFTALQSSLSFLWGTVDSYNFVELFNGTTSLGQISGSNLYNTFNPATGMSYAGESWTTTITSNLGRFDKVVFSSTGCCFEIANVATVAAPVPGPIAGAGLPMLVAGALWMMRRRNSAA